MDRSPARRGQAMVEMALGSLVFVTILLFGIHFAEHGYLSIKVQEAAAYAIWDSTGQRPTKINSTDDFPNILARANANGLSNPQGRYQDFNGLSSETNSAVITAAAARGDSLKVQCSPVTGWANPIASPADNFPPEAPANAVYRDTPGIGCSSSAVIGTFNIPTRFVDQGGGGFFQEKHLSSAFNNIMVCGVGRARASTGNSNCEAAKVSILLDDWGMVGNSEGGDALNNGGPNTTYRDAVGSMYGPSSAAGGPSCAAGLAFANQFAGGAPAVCGFQFNFAGIENSYLGNSAGGESGGSFNTGGPGPTERAGGGGWSFHPFETEKNCFLGVSDSLGCSP